MIPDEVLPEFTWKEITVALCVLATLPDEELDAVYTSEPDLVRDLALRTRIIFDVRRIDGQLHVDAGRQFAIVEQ